MIFYFQNVKGLLHADITCSAKTLLWCFAVKGHCVNTKQIYTYVLHTAVAHDPRVEWLHITTNQGLQCKKHKKSASVDCPQYYIICPTLLPVCGSSHIC